MAKTAPGPDLAQRLATTATGYAVVYKGVLDIGTVSDTKRKAASKGVGKIISSTVGMMMVSSCTDESCFCFERFFTDTVPDAKIVAVSVEVSHD